MAELRAFLFIQAVMRGEARASRFAAAVIALFALISVGTGLTNDETTLLSGALDLLRYGDVYHHLAEMNPPLIFFLYLPAALAMQVGIPGAAALHLYVLILSLASLALTARHGLPDASAAERRRVLLAAGCGLFFFSAFFGAFADREMLFFVFTLPWIVARLRGRETGVGIALFSVSGFCLKPYNFAVFGLLLLVGGPTEEGFRRKFLSPSSLVIAGAALFYFAAVRWFSPYYLFTVAPLAAKTYPYLCTALWRRLCNAALFGLLVVLCRPLLSPARRRASLALLAGAMVMFVLNGGWLYTYYALAFALSLAIANRPATDQDAPLSVHLVTARVVLATLALLLSAATVARMGMDVYWTARSGHSSLARHVLPQPAVEAALRRQMAPRFIMLSTSTWSAMLAEPEESSVSAQPFDYLWPLPYAITQHGAARADAMRQLDTALVAGLQSNPPPVVVVEESPAQRRLPPNFAILDFLKEDPGFAAAFASYRFAGRIDGCTGTVDQRCRYSIWRLDESGVAPPRKLD